MRGMIKVAALVAVVACAACESGVTLVDPKIHNYGHALMAPPTPQVSSACTQQDLTALAAPYLNPPLMALGDSLYNGVSSLRINWWLSEWSVPSQVAIGLGLIPQDKEWQRTITAEQPRRFWGPQYPGVDQSDFDGYAPNYGVNIERIGLGRIIFHNALGELGKHLVDLYDYRPPSGRLFNDNLAFSGADTIDILYRDAKAMRDRLTSPRLGLEGTNDLARLRTLARSGLLAYKAMSSVARGFYLINAGFVLNPMRHPCIDTLTPVEQVLLRKPKRLLVSIGSNNGIYRMGLEGIRLFDTVTDESAGHCTCIAAFIGETYIKDVRELIAKLEAEDEIETVYLNALIPPSRIANLIPTSEERLTGTGYYRSYKTDFSITETTPIDGAEVKRADEFVSMVTAEVQRAMDEANGRVAAKRAGRPGPARKFVMIDVKEVTGRYDYKHTPVDEKRYLVARGTRDKGSVYFDMRPLRFDDQPRVYSNIASGGFVSFDNMHLTPSGYAMLSGEVLDAIARNEKVSHPEFRPLVSPRNLFVLKSNAPYNFSRYGSADADEIRGRLGDLVSKVSGEIDRCLPRDAPQWCRGEPLPAWGTPGR